MNEDEAFIRAIVDNPGDDTNRLVYADWLDDRADPRGPYLRAEAEWAAPWRTGKRPKENAVLRQQAATLAPLWVARVSRPPIGVCLTHIGITRSRVTRGVNAHLTSDDLERLAQDFRLDLPTEYAAFLLNQNGGKLDRCSVEVHRRVENEVHRRVEDEEADIDGDGDEEGGEPSYTAVPAGHAQIVPTFYPISFAYRELPSGQWDEPLDTYVVTTDNPAAILQADLYKVIRIGKNAGAIPGEYELLIEDYETGYHKDDGRVGLIFHQPNSLRSRHHSMGYSLAVYFAHLIPLSRVKSK